MKCLVPTNVTEFRSFFRETQYFRNFIASFSMATAQLHAIIVNGNIFQWGKNQHNTFYDMKRNINQAPVIVLQSL